MRLFVDRILCGQAGSGQEVAGGARSLGVVCADFKAFSGKQSSSRTTELTDTIRTTIHQTGRLGCEEQPPRAFILSCRASWVKELGRLPPGEGGGESIVIVTVIGRGYASPSNERTTVESTMSVRKLALAALDRVNSLRQSLAENRKPIAHSIALTAGLLVVSGGTVAQAQHGHHLPEHDPLMLDADYRWFEPITAADLADMKPSKRANTGWYGGVDYMHLWLTRPENDPSTRSLLDSGRGHRLDLGYMLDNDHGWGLTYMGFEVNAYDGYDRERLNRYNLEALEGEGGVVGPPFGLIEPRTDDNNFGFNNRFVAMRNSENVADFHSLELNKTWRLEPYHYGGMLEPLVGFRYMRFADTYQRMTYNAGPYFHPTDPTTILGGEMVTYEVSEALNDFAGGQIGFRYFKFVDRFRYSAELRVFALGSFQNNRYQNSSELTLYDNLEVAAEDAVAHYMVEKSTPLYGRNNDFAWGYDIRSELSYTLSRMIELRAGLQLVDIAQGVWRGRLYDQTASQDQRALMAGITFGVTLNR